VSLDQGDHLETPETGEPMANLEPLETLAPMVLLVKMV